MLGWEKHLRLAALETREAETRGLEHGERHVFDVYACRGAPDSLHTADYILLTWLSCDPSSSTPLGGKNKPIHVLSPVSQSFCFPSWFVLYMFLIKPPGWLKSSASCLMNERWSFQSDHATSWRGALGTSAIQPCSKTSSSTDSRIRADLQRLKNINSMRIKWWTSEQSVKARAFICGRNKTIRMCAHLHNNEYANHFFQIWKQSCFCVNAKFLEFFFFFGNSIH